MKKTSLFIYDRFPLGFIIIFPDIPSPFFLFFLLFLLFVLYQNTDIGNNENLEENRDAGSNSTTTPGIFVGVYKLAVLRVIFSCLTSISGKLQDDPESTKMLLKYFTTEHVSRKIYLLRSNNSNQSDNLNDYGEEEQEKGDGPSTSLETDSITAQLIYIPQQISQV